MQIYIDGIGVWGAGLRDWPQMRSVLAGETAFAPEPVALPSPAVLPPAERRRSPGTARVAVQVAAEACAMAGANPALLPSVFASSHGDTEITDYMCRELAADAPVSPTKFHNSVHNAASGYWTIAVGCTQSANAVSAGDDSFGSGLLEAAVQVVSESRPILFVAYDLAAPVPLATVCPVRITFGVALVLSPVASARSVACLRFAPETSTVPPGSAVPPTLEPLLNGNPAARALPLLSCLAKGETARIQLPPFHWEIASCR